MPPPPTFDISDQENAAPMRPPLRHSVTNLARDLGSTLSMSPGSFAAVQDEDNDGFPVAGPSNAGRKPLSSIEAEDDDPFTSPLRGKASSFTEMLQQSTPRDDHDTPIPTKSGLTRQDTEPDFSQAVGGAFKPLALEPSFSELFNGGTQKAPPLTFGEPLGLGAGLSFGSEKNLEFDNLRQNQQPLGLTQDVALRPAFAVSQGKLREADEIFEKEQNAIIEAALPKAPQREETFYINDHGFLTQTRPDMDSPQVYRAFSQASMAKTQSTQITEPLSPLMGASALTQSARNGALGAAFMVTTQPSQTGGLLTSQDSPGPLRRLRRRDETDDSPPLRNAFDVLKQNVSKPKLPQKRAEKNAYVENEAAESDDEADFGGRGSGDEADGEDLDQNLAEIVDDAKMTEEQLAEARVREAYERQAQEDDAKMAEKVQEVVDGKHRKRKRRGAGVDDEDEDATDEEREEMNAAARRKMRYDELAKDLNLKALQARPETASFAAAYTATIEDEDANEFAYLMKDGGGLRLPQEDTEMGDADDESEVDEEERRPLKTSEVQARLREMAQRTAEEAEDDDDEPIDFGALLDDEEEEEDVRFRVIKTAPTRVPLADGDPEFQSRQASFDIADNARLEKWARDERRKHGGTGRATVSATITGNKVKSGGGSLRPGQAAVDARQQLEARRRPVKAAPSVLAGVSRAARFGP